jgi:mRNA-degrading endonuclease toxin of MazEF toxin-antitoxin module
MTPSLGEDGDRILGRPSRFRPATNLDVPALNAARVERSRAAAQAIAAEISQVRTLSVERIGKKLGRATPEELAQVVEGLNEIIGA